MPRRALMLVIAAALLVACDPGAEVIFRTTLTDSDGSYPLPVTVRDRSGLVVAIAPERPEGGRDLWAEPGISIRSDAASNALIVSWMGGACEDEVSVVFWPDRGRYGLMLASLGGPGLFGGCVAIGLPRAIRITTSEAVPADLISIVGGNP